MIEHTESIAEAATLLLRSPRWSVTEVMELLEIGDEELRRMVAQDKRLDVVLRQRRADPTFNGLGERTCQACGEHFYTATFRVYCGAPACRISKGR